MAPKGAAKNEDLTATKLFDVSNFAAVVTGGGTGIGLMITQALVANGARVYIVGRRSDPLQSVVEKYSTGPGKIIALVFRGLRTNEPDALQLHCCSSQSLPYTISFRPFIINSFNKPYWCLSAN